MTARPYRPSNGTEGDIFMSKFCFQCARDCEDNPCQILGRILFNGINDPDYPKEFIEDERGPRCTAFIQEGSEVPDLRCKDTMELF